MVIFVGKVQHVPKEGDRKLYWYVWGMRPKNMFCTFWNGGPLEFGVEQTFGFLVHFLLSCIGKAPTPNEQEQRETLECLETATQYARGPL